MGGKSGGGGSSKTTTTMDPWKPAQGQLQDILRQAQELYTKNGSLDAEAVQREIPGLTPEMAKSLSALADTGQLQAMSQDIDKYTGQAGDYLSRAGQMAQDFASKDFSVTGDQINGLSSQLYDSDLVRSQKEQLAQDIQDQYAQGVQQLNQAAGASGNMGNSRAGVAQGVMFGKNQQNLEKGSADIMNSARQQALTAATSTLQQNAANRLNQYSQGMQTLGNLGTNLAAQHSSNVNQQYAMYQQGLNNQAQAANVSQQMQNAQQETRYQNQVAQQQAGQENLNNYLNTVGKIGGLGGANSGTQSGGASGPSKGQAALGGAMSGAASGAMIGSVVPGVGTAIGAVAGGVIGGASGLFSDATLKKNIKIKGKTKKGDAVYDWDWNEKGKQKGLKGKSSGVLAQNVMKDKPSAVGKKQGALMVDYDQTSVKPKQKKK